ncbi:hypothetical protein QVZ41_14415 [Wenyingzhuangia sp. chi5]|uniref:Uncharacterized protein n=1 Tax=Wenyingzhuangia gilva TaxID=3057677 RepID=A0ABT8VVN5_9FLAO|nr:hypothetical protein [Wenyingzhuangia sp. chi5]MDO3696043.1 hypothetical protein [Wenyingzhuangia sp. chi5]
MKKNRFLEKFEKKSNTELEEIISDNKTYVKEARNAAFEILQNRDKENETVLKVENEIKAKIEQNRIIEEKRKKEISTENIFEELDNPNLYSKKVIMGFSCFFSTIFGSILLMHNMDKTDNSKVKIYVMSFGILYTVFTIILMNTLNINGLPLIFNLIGGWILNNFFWNKYIGENISFNEKNYTKQVLISVLIIIPFVLAMIYS